MFKLKYQPELKDALSKIRAQFSTEGLDYVLNSLFRENFIQVYDELRQLDIEVTKLNSRIMNSIIFNLTQLEELQRLESLLTEMKSSGYQLDAKHE